MCIFSIYGVNFRTFDNPLVGLMALILNLKFQSPTWKHFSVPRHSLRMQTAPAPTICFSNYDCVFNFYKLFKIKHVALSKSKLQMKTYAFSAVQIHLGKNCLDLKRWVGNWVGLQDTPYQHPGWPTHFLNALLFNPFIKCLALLERNLK